MKKILLFLTIIYCTGLYSQEYADNRIILQLKKDRQKQVQQLSELEELDFLFEENKVKEIKVLDIQESRNINGRPLVVVFNHAEEIEPLISNLERTNLFEYVEFDFIVQGSGNLMSSYQNELIQMVPPPSITPNDPYFFRQWGLYNDGTFSLSTSLSGADVKMKDAWEITTGNENIVVAVIDSGIKMDHPEFVGRIYVNPNEYTNGFDNDGNGYIDDVNGWDFVNDDNNPTDDHGHGTNVSGIAVANANNGIGYAGADWNCKLLPLKTLSSDNFGYTSDMIAAIYYAVNAGVDVISMSIGGTGYSAVYHNAVMAAYDANISLIACMMNFNNNIPYYPAAFPETIAVGSTDPNDYRTAPFFWDIASGSNYGSHIDVVAPGNYIYGLSHTSNTNYEIYWGGTSQATPLVAGIVTLMLSIEPSLTIEQIRNILRNTAQDQVGRLSEDVAGWDQYHGAGRVDAYQALLTVQNLSVENNQKKIFKVYPNPTKGMLNLEGSENIQSIKIYDTTGRLTKEINRVEIQLDISVLEKGVYILEIMTTDNHIQTEKIIKE